MCPIRLVMRLFYTWKGNRLSVSVKCIAAVIPRQLESQSPRTGHTQLTSVRSAGKSGEGRSTLITLTTNQFPKLPG